MELNRPCGCDKGSHGHECCRQQLLVGPTIALRLCADDSSTELLFWHYIDQPVRLQCLRSKLLDSLAGVSNLSDIQHLTQLKELEA